MNKKKSNFPYRTKRLIFIRNKIGKTVAILKEIDTTNGFLNQL